MGSATAAWRWRRGGRRRYVVAFVVLVFSNVSYGTRELPHPRYASVENLLVPPEIDCALRAFAIEMAAYIAPDAAKANWTALTKSAFQMNQCNGTSNISFEPPKSAKPFQTAPPMQRRTCEHTVFVHGLKGNDLFDGTFDRPMRTIKSALTHTRRLRAMHGSQSIICMTIRGGTYYLGTNATTTSSQIGVIALTSNDSNLIIENYPGELVTLSGGTELKLQWSVHAKTALGATIMKAQVPDSINLDQFNELYIDGTRAIVAKYPNGDPSTQGIYAANPGYTYDVQGWAPPVHSPSTDIYIQSPSRAGTVFPNYQLGVGGGASVFDPPENFWSTASPPAGGNYAVPTGLTAKSGALPNLGNWSNASTGFVHTFHGGYWGGWIFQIASSSAADNSIKFSRGGFQEARGWGGGGPIYVSNIFEELDSANEWFLDKTTRTLYFMPNDTMPNTFVASQVPCIISVSGGDIEDSAQNIVIQGLTFTQTTNTYMRGYMVPSGGDWSVHRGGTIFLKNTKNVTIAHSLFTQLGSNGIAVIDYNDATTISSNEFVWLGDSGIVLVGTTNGIDGFSVKSQPMNTLIQSNIFHELGIYVKQSAPLLIAVSRSVSVIGNLIFNIPRAGVNINDGFYGNHTLAHNVMFNTVRETSDHGPINSWDRQPYLTDSVQQGVPSLWQHTNYIHHNLLFNNYRSVWPIDHDDGSCFYEDSYNFQVYGGKKNYLGHSKTDHHEIYVYADSNVAGFGSNTCLGDYNPQPGASGWNETYVNNICTLYSIPIPYHIDGCETTHLYAPYLANNTIFVPPGSEVAFMCKVNGQDQRLSLQQWQAIGVDIGTVVETTPDVQTIIGWGRKMLQDSM